MSKRAAKPVEHVSEEAVSITKDKAPAGSVEQALVDLVDMVRFLNANKGYWAEDYMNEERFKASALGRIVEKHSK